MMNRAPESIDEYILSCPEDIRELLQNVRRTIREAEPQAAEKISYRMPTFELYGNLVHFAAFKNHIGFYPAPSGITAFSQELAPYKTSKGAVQFPLSLPVPYDLIARIVKFRSAENRELAEAKGQSKKQ